MNEVVPRVSVLMPTHQQAAFLPRALGGLLTQTVEEWEVALVDDGSTDGTAVAAALVGAARAEGATDVEIHDVVLIAAAFCMYNRYVDGLGTAVPDDPGRYAESVRRITSVGYAADR